MVWTVNDDVTLERDTDGFALQVRHLQSPYLDEASRTDPYSVATSYLQRIGPEIGVSPSQIDFLERNPPKESDEEGAKNWETGAQLRWWRRREIGNRSLGTTVALIIQQTHDIPIRLRLEVGGKPVFEGSVSLPMEVHGSGLRVVMHRRQGGEFAVTGVTSTLRRAFDFRHATALAADGAPVVIRLPLWSSNDNLEAPEKGGAGLARTFAQISTSLLLPQILQGLGLDPSKLPSEAGFWIYRYKPSPSNEGATLGLTRRRGAAGRIENADYPVCIMRHTPYFFDEPNRVALDTAPLDIVSRLGDNAVLSTIPLMAGATAKPSTVVRPPSAWVFPIDPISAGVDARPNRPSQSLRGARRTVTLANLEPPSGRPPYQKLRGTYVVVVDRNERNQPGLGYGSLGFDPPREPQGHAFKYEERTNEFAAVNAYYHLDRMFHRLQLFGLGSASYASKPGFAAQAEAIHRAAIRPGPGGDGRCINAQFRIRPGREDGTAEQAKHRFEFRFALADLTINPGPPQTYDDKGNPRRRLKGQPLGIACDVRWVWHEFGHALIAGATGDLELRFAHSVGDALAAINCDPDSVLATAGRNRGITFPWVTLPNRRHDREASLGWSWSSTYGGADGYRDDVGDRGGYRREQILSSTLFRLYRACGGDAVDRHGVPRTDERYKAADYVTYLIARALGSLGPASTVPAVDAGAFAAALMDADAATLAFDYPGLPPRPVSQHRVGGTLHKVIRWAFEKQGLYATANARPDGSGQPERIDVYIDDGRRGEYRHAARWDTPDTELWLRHQPDGLPKHQEPVRNSPNYLYLRVRNRGQETALGTTATLRAVAAATPVWPDSRWIHLAPRNPGEGLCDVPADGHLVVGPFVWTPTRRGEHTLLAEVDAPGDRSNINRSTGLPSALPHTPATPLAAIVPYDNNLATARWTVR
ncbi:MAG: hypothetical protein U1E21_13180 [Reyranellaceae bacterium]